MPNISALYREDLETKLNEFREQLACQDCKAVVAAEVDRILAGFNNLQVSPPSRIYTRATSAKSLVSNKTTI